ncbi:MAG: flagellar basal body rod protein FlgB [Burkholderiales bacterium]|nr:flagellar basal body rod protein FlgB [Burkholderiales bacterium]
MLDRLTQSLDFQAKALELRSERQRLIASNIANADTPGYQAKDFDFAQALSQATGARSIGQRSVAGQAVATSLPTAAAAASVSSVSTASLAPAATNARHLGGGTASGLATDPRLLYARNSQTSLDSNTVDMDRERASFADNTVKYEATLRFINGSVKTMLTAITGQP